MKSLKTKVMASLAMLLVAAVMLTSSSFAWYTISTKGELSQVKAEMTATDTMEIAVSQYEPVETELGDAGNQQTWGTTAVYEDATSSIVQVAQYSDDNTEGKAISGMTGLVCKLWTPHYDETNRPQATLSEASTESDAVYYETYAQPQIWEDVNGDNCAYVYDFWTRSNKYAKVTLSDNGSEFIGGDGTTGSLTVVFVDVPTGKVLSYWDKGTQASFTYDASPNGDDYYVSHIAVYVYADGNSVKAKDIDSLEAAGGKLPSFIGKFRVDGADS